MVYLLPVLLLLLVWSGAVQAQRVVTDDEVNAIAKTLYCPVCENIPLDACGTAACDDWRYEIRLQLEAGKTEQEIVDDFVRRFGDRVVGTPQDPLLRAVALIVPLVGIVAALGLALYVFTRRTPKVVPAAPAATDKYQSILERDLAG
jgi:cytochrome c-type biogenesis protein CcmH